MEKVYWLVKQALKRDEACRNDDFKLIKAVIMQIAPEVLDYPMGNVLEYHKDYGIPSFETVTRARRMIQSEDETLKAVDYVEAKRQEQEEKIRNFVK